MSGHNRWSKIKRKKAVIGAAKGKLFTKLIKEITVAARLGGGDPAGNARLRSAIEAAKAANMPGDTVQRAVKKGTGELEGVAYEEVTYEGYGPGGVAVVVTCLTDNRARTAGDVRLAFKSGGGNLGEPNSVTFSFEHKGVFTVAHGEEDKVLEAALDAGALDVINHGADGFEVRTEPNDVHKVNAALQNKGFATADAKVVWLPLNTVKLDEEKAKKMLKLLELLEDNDDVQDVFANYEIDDAVMERLTA